MDFPITVACGFLDGTILSVEGGYRVLQHPRPERVFERISDARWFLAVNWCEHCPAPAGILTHDGTLSFENPAIRVVGATEFLPFKERASVFRAGFAAQPGKPAIYTIRKSNQHDSHQLEVMNLEIDPRYGKVAIVRALNMGLLPERSPF